MKTDSEIERDVRDELRWNPDLKSTDIAMSVKDGVVTLAGFVPRYIDKYQAKKAAKRVAGVLALANDMKFVSRQLTKGQIPRLRVTRRRRSRMCYRSRMKRSRRW